MPVVVLRVATCDPRVGVGVEPPVHHKQRSVGGFEDNLCALFAGLPYLIPSSIWKMKPIFRKLTVLIFVLASCL